MIPSVGINQAMMRHTKTRAKRIMVPSIKLFDATKYFYTHNSKGKENIFDTIKNNKYFIIPINDEMSDFPWLFRYCSSTFRETTQHNATRLLLLKAQNFGGCDKRRCGKTTFYLMTKKLSQVFFYSLQARTAITPGNDMWRCCRRWERASLLGVG